MISLLAKKIFASFVDVTKMGISILKILIAGSFFSDLKHKTCVKTNNCLIMGNGPSLRVYLNNNIDYENFGDVFVVNDFALAKEYLIVKPRYYVFADPGYWSNNVPAEVKILREEVFSKLNTLTQWELTILIPKQCYISNIFQQKIENKNIKMIYFNTTEIGGFPSFQNYCYKRNLGMPPLQNVLHAAIYTAIFYNYKKINLVGAEHSWTKNLFVNEKNEVCQFNPHFYAEDVKDNVWLKWDGQPYKMFEILKDLSRVFYSYEVLERFAKFKQCTVLNLTKHSYIDSFDRSNTDKSY